MEYFRRKGVREILEPVLEESGISWYTYLQNARNVLGYLEENRDLKIVRDVKDVGFEGLLMYPEDDEIVRNSLRFIKRGNEVKIPRVGSRSVVVDGRVSLENLINGTLDRVDGEYSGYSIRGIRRDRVRKVRLIDCVKGSELFCLGDVEVRGYLGSEVERTGGKFNVKVPSKSSDRVYSFMMENIPVRRRKSRDRECLANVFDFRTSHDCEAKGWNGLHFRRKVGEDYSCLHEVAGYLAVEKFLEESPYEVVVSPFLVPSDDMWEYSRKLREKGLKEFRQTDKLRRRVLNEVMLEVLLWRKLSKDGMFKCFRKKGEWMGNIG